jgi:hypothetical protein
MVPVKDETTAAGNTDYRGCLDRFLRFVKIVR